jgi:UDP-glucose 4-epimerase
LLNHTNFNYGGFVESDIKESMTDIKNMLVPGGLGFIGSHTVVHILEQTAASVIIIDDMSNCFQDVLERIKLILISKLTSEQIESRLQFKQGNILDLPFLDSVFSEQLSKGTPIDAIMHFAAKKAIGESFAKPMDYYENNVVGSMNLFNMMEKYKDCKNFIFSSTAGVYGDKDNCTETDLKKPNSPYGESKACVEMLLASLAKVHQDWRVISLRYFNPCGAHSSYLLGD